MAFAPGSSRSVFGFDPRSIPGCALWLDASDIGATGGGATVSSWKDKSGFGSNATANSAITLTQNAMGGRPALSFNANTPQWLLGSTSITSNTLTVCVVFSMQSNSGAAARTVALAATGTNDYNNTSYVGILRQNGTTMGPNRNGAWLPGSFSYATPVVSVSLFDGANAYLYTNGTAQSSYASTGNFAVSSYAIAANTNTADAHYFTGFIGEVIVYSSALTTVQRQQVEGYLAWKWGFTPLPFYSTFSYTGALQSYIVPPGVTSSYVYMWGAGGGGVNGGNEGGAGAYIQGILTTTPGETLSILVGGGGKFGGNGTTNPVPAAGGYGGGGNANSGGGTYAGGPANNGGNGNAGGGRSAIQRSGTEVVTVGGGGGAGYGRGGSATWQGTANNGNYNWPNNDGAGGSQSNGGAAGINGNPTVFGLATAGSQFQGGNGNNYGGGGGGGWYGGGGGSTTNGYGAAGGGGSSYTSNLSSASGIDGGAVGAAPGQSLSFYASGVATGSNTLSNGSGGPGLVVLSSSPLTGISSGINLPSSHPFYSIRPGLRTFRPIDIDGCALWLDANDATTFTLSGSNITSWNDKSGNANNATATGTPTYNTAGLNSRPATAFNGSCYFQGNVSITGQTLTCFAVGSFVNSGGGDQRFVSLAATGQADWNSASRVAAIFNQGSTTSIASYRNQPATFPRHSHSYGTPFIACSVYDGTNGYIYVNGLPGNVQASYASTGTFAISKYCIGEQVSVTGEIIRNGGFVSEVLTYTTALTTAQRQQVEGYLAKKWNLATVVPPFTNPTSIPGCTLWLDAQDSSTITGTSTVTQWRDKSGLACNTTAYYGSPALTAAAINGYQAISFNGSSYLFGSNSNSTTTATFFFVGTMSSSVAIYAAMFSFSPSNTNSWGATSSFNGGSPQSSGTRVITPQRNASGASSPKFTPGFNTPFIFTNVFDGTNWVGYGNGITLGSMASTGNFAYTKYVVGSEESSGGTLTTGWTGYIGELIAYNTALTATQRQQVEYYLSTKWGLTTASSFSPSMIPGLRLWLDAQDASTVTTSGGLVTNVADKSSNGWVLSGANGFSYPNNTFNGSYPSFYGSNPSNSWTLGSNASLTFTQPFTVFFVAQRLNLATSTNFYDGYVFDGLNSTNRCYMYGNWYVAGALTNSSMNVNIGTTTPVVVTTIFNTSNSSQYLNGTTFSSNVNGGTSNLSSGIRIANGWNNGNSWVGHFCELVIYNKVVSTTERQQVEYYLGTKWGLLTSNTFTPSVIPICPIWFDAADTTNIIRSGSQVTAWSNKGASQSVASNKTGVVTSGTATYNGRNIVQFPQSTNLSFTTTISNQPRAWFAVFRQTAQPSAQNPYFNIFANFSTSGGDQLAGPEFNGTLAEIRQGIAGMVGTTSATSGFNVFRIYNWTNSATSTSSNRVAINGTALALTDNSLASGYSTASLEYLIMRADSNIADLAELICINGEITVLQRQQMEYYLAQKWGLSGPDTPAYYGPSNVTFGPSAVSFAGSTTSVLPTTHPFVKIPPATTLPFSPLQITGCTLWLDANDPAGTGVQPSAGALATWTDKSGSNNHMTAAGTTPTFSNVPPGAVTFGGAGYYSKASAVFSNFSTAFFVYKQTAATGPLYTTGASSGSNGLFPNEAGTTYFTRGDSTWYTVSSPFTSNVTNLAGVSFSSNAVGSNQSLFYNGSNVVTTTQANTITYTNLLIGSRQSGGTQYFTGSIYEVLAYGGTLTTNERQRVEGYLAQKWKV